MIHSDRGSHTHTDAVTLNFKCQNGPFFPKICMQVFHIKYETAQTLIECKCHADILQT